MDELLVQCPYCGEEVELSIERDVCGQFVQDCEVCCRPWKVSVYRSAETDERGSEHGAPQRGDSFGDGSDAEARGLGLRVEVERAQ